jgi:alanine-glyoxylate transaminase/serine-glyoxylate transaminase/serine-pyruvate transaminase
LLVDEADRLPQLNAVVIPDGVDEALARKTLLANYGLEIGAGLGALAGKVWRIGLMGTSSSANHVTLCLAALENTLVGMGAPITAGASAEAARAVLFN